MKKLVMQVVSQTLMVTMVSIGVWSPNVQAALITVDQVAASQSVIENREHVRTFFDREDVQTQLQSRGVSTEAAKARVNAMTDNEIASIKGHIDSLPAGGTDILGFFLMIFVILLITDILGLTKVFPFTRHR